jgi:hypothetical protein
LPGLLSAFLLLLFVLFYFNFCSLASPKNNLCLSLNSPRAPPPKFVILPESWGPCSPVMLCALVCLLSCESVCCQFVSADSSIEVSEGTGQDPFAPKTPSLHVSREPTAGQMEVRISPEAPVLSLPVSSITSLVMSELCSYGGIKPGVFGREG